MKLTVGYDRDLARQFFLRTFESLYPDGHMPKGKLLPIERDYMATRLAETVVFNNIPKLGSPWYPGDIRALAEETRNSNSRYSLQQAETAANQLLIFEGLVTRGGLENLRDWHREKPLNRPAFASTLYANSARWHGHSDPQRFVLKRLAMNVPNWVLLLREVAGQDYFEMLVNQPTSSIFMP